MFKLLLVLVAIVASVSAFVPAAAPRAGVTALKAYVPDGISAAEYEALKAEKAAAAAARKQKFANKKYEDLTEWLLERDAKFPGQPGAGHRFAKVVDADKAKPRAGL